MPTTVTNELKNENSQLLREYKNSGSNEVRNQLVKLNIGLARKEVHHWLNQCDETYDDLLQVGCIGLIRAIERFDLSKGHAFSSFAIPYIRGEIQHYLRDKSPSVRFPRHWSSLERKSVSVIKDLQVQFNRNPRDYEVAAVLDISVEEWREIKLARLNRSPLSLDAPVQDEDDGATCLGALVPDSKYRSFQLAQEDQIRVQQALSLLEKRTREILEFVFLYDLTQKETAERLGISAVTVSRRVKKGLDLLKEIMTKQL
ncbi:MAG: RNA polymerase sigma factor SigF [Oscillatoriales cyanobacterium]|nr:MAG: RNA polymerase sigma factor SigF [Oscillatoriales cyanobacterium]TAH23311.1 MAG: RNA polymerase sigma factor SigF [Oscillatoriales cyanobacterium]